jgi:hypothetical protein
MLDERDIDLLTIMAPEFSGESCRGSGVAYKSLLPPVANHYASSAIDFKERISRLSKEEFKYLTELMLSGEESLHCLSPDYFSFIEERIREESGEDIARKIGARYAMDSE